MASIEERLTSLEQQVWDFVTNADANPTFNVIAETSTDLPNLLATATVGFGAAALGAILANRNSQKIHKNQSKEKSLARDIERLEKFGFLVNEFWLNYREFHKAIGKAKDVFPPPPSMNELSVYSMIHNFDEKHELGIKEYMKEIHDALTRIHAVEVNERNTGVQMSIVNFSEPDQEEDVCDRMTSLKMDVHVDNVTGAMLEKIKQRIAVLDDHIENLDRGSDDKQRT